MFALALLAAGAAPSRAEEVSSRDLVVEIGRADFLRHCAACHGADARGAGPTAPALTMPPPDLTRIAERRGGTFPSREVAEIVDGRRPLAAHGSREMPVWGRVFYVRIHEASTEEEVVQGRLLVLVEYLKSIQTGQAR
jgi:mono/diheme cytochrome c family protein